MEGEGQASILCGGAGGRRLCQEAQWGLRRAFSSDPGGFTGSWKPRALALEPLFPAGEWGSDPGKWELLEEVRYEGA